MPGANIPKGEDKIPALLSKPEDNMREICIEQGYVPVGCTLPGMMVFGLVNKGECPCDGCNENRAICKGKPKKY